VLQCVNVMLSQYGTALFRFVKSPVNNSGKTPFGSTQILLPLFHEDSETLEATTMHV